MTQAEIGELLSDQVYSFLNDLKARKRPSIEAEFDDEGTDQRLGLDRWQDRQFTQDIGFGPMQRRFW